MHREKKNTLPEKPNQEKSTLSDRDLLIMVACWNESLQRFLRFTPLSIPSSEGPGVYEDYILPKFPPPVEQAFRDIMTPGPTPTCTETMVNGSKGVGHE